MSKHTEGPWEYYPEDNLISAPGVHRLIDIIPRSLEVSSDERIANGKLIAAAPELLEALKLARDGLYWYQLTHPEYVNGCDYEAMEHIDGVIAKAEGKPIEEN